MEGEGGKLRRAPSWRKKFRTKDPTGKTVEEVDPGVPVGATPDPFSQPSPQHARRATAIAVAPATTTATTAAANNTATSVEPLPISGLPISAPAPSASSTARKIGDNAKPY